MPKDLILHDLPPEEAEKLFGGQAEGNTPMAAQPPVAHCVGCFGCWIKTPGKCVLPDRGSDFALLLPKHERLVVVSRLVFGGLSPDVKAIMDRMIGFILPFFHMVNGEMHHVKRYDNPPAILYIFHGENMPDAQRETARRLVAANALNLVAPAHRVAFCATAGEIREVLG